MIFGNTDLSLAPFTDEQWYNIMQWYKVMAFIVGIPILIAVVILAYKIIMSGINIQKRNEAKDNIFRLFFGAAAIAFAPIFVKLMLFLNNNLVNILVSKTHGGLDDLLGNSLLTNIKTGSAILTAIVIAMFAYLFVKLNIKFIVRQFTLIVFTIFTPVVAVMWIINRRAIGASIWFGQILINSFMQFIYCFLFLVYLDFLPISGGWAVSLLWALMILPLADVLQNTLQNLVSRIAGIQNDEIANRGIGLAAEMAHSVRAFTYQFKGNQVNGENSSGILSNFMNRTPIVNNKKDSNNPIQTNIIETNPVQTNPMHTNPIEPKTATTQEVTQGKQSISNTSEIKSINNDINNIQNNTKTSPLGMIAKAGGAFFNTGMYMAEGRNFRNHNYETQRKQNRSNINNSRKSDYAIKKEMDSVLKTEMEKAHEEKEI